MDREELLHLLLGDLLSTATDQGVEGDGVSALATGLGDDAALLLTLGDELETLEGAAAPVEKSGGGLAVDLGAGSAVLLVGEALGEASVAGTGAEVDGAENGGATDVVPVVVLGGALATVGGLDDLGARGDEELTLILEVLGHGLHPAPGVNIADGGTLAASNVSDVLLLVDNTVGHNVLTRPSL